MLFQIKGQFRILCQSVILTFLTFPNYLRHVHDYFNIHIIEIISQSVLSFIQIFTIIKIIYLITVNLNKILQLQENYFFFLFRFCWKCFIALEKASRRTPPRPSRGGGNSLRLYFLFSTGGRTVISVEVDLL